MRFSIAQDTRRGARPTNQDRVGHARAEEALLMVVADGLGGHLHGEIAAQIALDHVQAAFDTQARPRLGNPELFLPRAIGGAHAAILDEARSKRLRESPRTCIAACVVQQGHAYWSHIGDCRIYLLREGRILTRTRDHSLVQSLVDQGRIREEAVASHPERNRLLQCLGGQVPRFEPVAVQRLAKGDVVLLCSDGFWGPLTQRQLVNAFLTRETEQAVPELAALAEARGGTRCDNVSAVAMRWGEEEIASGEPVRTVPQYELPTKVQDLTATDPDTSQ